MCDVFSLSCMFQERLIPFCFILVCIIYFVSFVMAKREREDYKNIVDLYGHKCSVGKCKVVYSRPIIKQITGY